LAKAPVNRRLGSTESVVTLESAAAERRANPAMQPEQPEVRAQLLQAAVQRQTLAFMLIPCMPRPFPITINYVFPGGQPKGRALHRTHGFVERGNRTLLDECFRVAGVLQSLEEMTGLLPRRRMLARSTGRARRYRAPPHRAL
jgi:hypothetical protein